jgi:hypothetical protein
MEDKPAKTVLHATTQYSLVDADDESIGIDQPVTSIELDLFDSLLEGNVSGSPTRILMNCPADAAIPASEASATAHRSEKPKTERRWHSDDGNRVAQRNYSAPEGPASFRPFNNRYWIGEEIGNGGMGQVYRGWDLNLQRYLAIKIIRKDYEGNAQHLFRFLREARIASKLGHPSVCACKRSCPPRFKTREHHDWCLTIDLTIGSQTNKGFRSWNRAETLGG